MKNIFLFFTSFLYFSTTITSLKTNNNENCQSIVEKRKLKENFNNEQLKEKYFKFLGTIKYDENYENVKLFHTNDNEKIYFKNFNQEQIINVTNESNNSSFALNFDGNNFSIENDIKWNYLDLNDIIDKKLNLLSYKNYQKEIWNFNYFKLESFKFSGELISLDKQSIRKFNGKFENKNLTYFHLDSYDWSNKKSFLAIFFKWVGVVGGVITIAFGLYSLAGAFFAWAGAAGAGLAGAEAGAAGAAGAAGGEALSAGADEIGAGLAGAESGLASSEAGAAGAAEGATGAVEGIGSNVNDNSGLFSFFRRFFGRFRGNRSEDINNNEINNNNSIANNSIANNENTIPKRLWTSESEDRMPNNNLDNESLSSDHSNFLDKLNSLEGESQDNISFNLNNEEINLSSNCSGSVSNLSTDNEEMFNNFQLFSDDENDSWIDGFNDTGMNSGSGGAGSYSFNTDYDYYLQLFWQ